MSVGKGTQKGGDGTKVEDKSPSLPGTDIEGESKGKNESPSAPPDGSSIEDWGPEPSSWGGPEIILDDASNGGADDGGRRMKMLKLPINLQMKV